MIAANLHLGKKNWNVKQRGKRCRKDGKVWQRNGLQRKSELQIIDLKKKKKKIAKLQKIQQF